MEFEKCLRSIRKYKLLQLPFLKCIQTKDVSLLATSFYFFILVACMIHPFCIVCSPGYFGIDCIERCSSHCVTNQYCEHVSGVFFDGCQDGYIGTHCDESKTYWLFLHYKVWMFLNNIFFLFSELILKIIHCYFYSMRYYKYFIQLNVWKEVNYRRSNLKSNMFHTLGSRYSIYVS